MVKFLFHLVDQTGSLGGQIVRFSPVIGKVVQLGGRILILDHQFVIPHTNGTGWTHAVDVVVVRIMKIEGFPPEFLVFFFE